MGSQLTGPLSSCWNSTALTPGLSLVYKISLPCLYFYLATWSFDNRYISAGKHLIHKMFTLYTMFPLWSWWLAWKALNYVTYWIFLSGLDAPGVPVITFQIDYNLRNIPSNTTQAVNCAYVIVDLSWWKIQYPKKSLCCFRNPKKSRRLS